MMEPTTESSPPTSGEAAASADERILMELRAAAAKGIPLPDGRRVTFPRKPIGRDLVKASAIAGGRGQIALVLAIVAQVGVAEASDGAQSKLTYEEVEELDLNIVFALMGAVVGNLSPGLATLLA